MKVIDSLDKVRQEVGDASYDTSLYNAIVKDINIPSIESNILLKYGLSNVIFINCSFDISSKKIQSIISGKVSFINCSFGKNFEIVFKGMSYSEKKGSVLLIRSSNAEKGLITLSGNIDIINIIDSSIECVIVSSFEKSDTLALINSNIKRLLFGDSIGYYKHFSVVADSLHFTGTKVVDFILFNQALLSNLNIHTSLYNFITSNNVSNVEICGEIRDSDLNNAKFDDIEFKGNHFVKCNMQNSDFSKSKIHVSGYRGPIKLMYCNGMDTMKLPEYLSLLNMRGHHTTITDVSDPRLKRES